jgi:membrane protease subunit (stomatin/prohibitin family)
MINNRIGLKQISAHLDNISEHLKNVMLPFWENLGLQLTKFYVTSIEVDNTTEAGRRVLDAISRQSAQSISGYTWQQEQAFNVANNAIEGISNSNSGLLGALVASNMMGGGGGLSGGMLQPQYNQPTFGGNNTPAPQANQTTNNAGVREVFCSNCSKKFPSSHRFCPHCGDPYDACFKCGTDNDKNAKRCVSCGTALQSDVSLCTNCNNPLAAGSAFCGSCGQKQNENNCTRCHTALAPGIKFCPKCGNKR